MTDLYNVLILAHAMKSVDERGNKVDYSSITKLIKSALNKGAQRGSAYTKPSTPTHHRNIPEEDHFSSALGTLPPFPSINQTDPMSSDRFVESSVVYVPTDASGIGHTSTVLM